MKEAKIARELIIGAMKYLEQQKTCVMQLGKSWVQRAYENLEQALEALKAEQEASSTYRTALQNIAAQSIIANTVESMAYVAAEAISIGREQRESK